MKIIGVIFLLFGLTVCEPYVQINGTMVSSSDEKNLAGVKVYLYFGDFISDSSISAKNGEFSVGTIGKGENMKIIFKLNKDQTDTLYFTWTEYLKNRENFRNKGTKYSL
ncbi:MAG: hypothetical protein LCH54_00185 [Bacteroidetes bacterium]|nr:hypothetical protein [Bacteroidota bacterium]